MSGSDLATVLSFNSSFFSCKISFSLLTALTAFFSSPISYSAFSFLSSFSGSVSVSFLLATYSCFFFRVLRAFFASSFKLSTTTESLLCSFSIKSSGSCFLALQFLQESDSEGSFSSASTSESVFIGLILTMIFFAFDVSEVDSLASNFGSFSVSVSSGSDLVEVAFVFLLLDLGLTGILKSSSFSGSDQTGA